MKQLQSHIRIINDIHLTDEGENSTMGTNNKSLVQRNQLIDLGAKNSINLHFALAQRLLVETVNFDGLTHHQTVLRGLRQ